MAAARGGELLLDLILSDEAAAAGAYTFQFFKHGTWQPVVVDNYLPCQPDQVAGGPRGWGWWLVAGRGWAAAGMCMRIRPNPDPDHSPHSTAIAMNRDAERRASGASAGPSAGSPYNLRARGPARRPAPDASDSSESSGDEADGRKSQLTPQQQAEQVRDGLRDLGFQLKDLNADQPGQPPAWVFWHPQLFLAEQVADIDRPPSTATAQYRDRTATATATAQPPQWTQTPSAALLGRPRCKPKQAKASQSKPKQAALGKRRKSTFTSPKLQKYNASRMGAQ